ncbi:MAG: SUMF1/EgtB/PvdO family nonheme iron enzyme [Chloroflexi bacterium]|nr:SUMF1/EgtB/PvdO family nonheme iron enzyme [Chloroflexota bacterium]
MDAIELLTIPAGTFWMGSPVDDADGFAQERPRHPQTIASDFLMARFPVTVAQWAQFRGVPDGYANVTWFEGLAVSATHRDSAMAPAFDEPDHPVQNVSWYEAMAFCRWLTVQWRESVRISAAQVVRLPSEAEWERAARGPTGGQDLYQRWAWGNTLTPQHANYVASDIGRTVAVGSHPHGRVPDWGVEDMIGNVWEWTSTKWVDDYEGYVPQDEAAGGENRVLRGGAWYFDHPLARCAFRGSDAPNYRNYRIGFRVVVAGT